MTTQATTPFPPANLQAVENAIVGEPLDAVWEIEARGSDWTLPGARN